jgi:ribosomal protein L37E
MAVNSAISIVPILTALGLLVAAGLLVLGWRGRRTPTDPHCRRCGYSLIHLQSNQCPECGTPVTPENTLHVTRTRRWGLLSTGLILLLLSSAMLVPQVSESVRNFPWYQYKPTAWVVNDLANPAMYRQAIAELTRREKAGQLNDKTHNQLIEKALQEQISTTTPIRQELLDYLGQAIANGKTTQEQTDRFVDQTCIHTIVTRPIVAEGDRVPVQIRHSHHHAPQSVFPKAFWCQRENGPIYIDGKPIQSGYGGGSGSLNGLSASTRIADAGGVGSHTVESVMECSIWLGQNPKQDLSQLIGKRKRTAQATYSVVPQGQAPKIELLDSPELRQKVLAAVNATGIRQHRDGHLEQLPPDSSARLVNSL